MTARSLDEKKLFTVELLLCLQILGEQTVPRRLPTFSTP
jgi:hypothetical protein